jgi:hypothetical protein
VGDRDGPDEEVVDGQPDRGGFVDLGTQGQQGVQPGCAAQVEVRDVLLALRQAAGDRAAQA